MPGSVKASIVKLENSIQHNAWGSRTAIAALQGRPTPTALPEAELWMGDHPVAPSSVVPARRAGATDDGAGAPLSEWLARDAEAVLGSARSRGDRLPFLAKVLAAARPLSLQVHPDAPQARAGFAREEAARIAPEERCYRDDNAKHEILVALSTFHALCGLRSDRELTALVGLAGSPALAALRADCAAEPGVAETSTAGRVLRALHALDAPERRRVYDEVAASVARPVAGEPPAWRAWVRTLCREHPGDPLVAAPLLMNLVSLAPGEALVVPPRTLHTYLEGVGVEVMTPSDNVVRAGLSPKHVDRDEVGRIASLRASAVGPLRPTRAAGGAEAIYPTGTPHFDVTSLRLGGDHPGTARRGGGRVTLVLCVEGVVELSYRGEGVSLGSGEAGLVPAALEHHGLAARSAARVFLVSAGPAPTAGMK